MKKTMLLKVRKTSKARMGMRTTNKMKVTKRARRVGKLTRRRRGRKRVPRFRNPDSLWERSSGLK